MTPQQAYEFVNTVKHIANEQLLTKREQFAKAAMEQMIIKGPARMRDIARNAVEMADEMMVELNKQK